MRSRPVAFLLADLGIAKSHSRPHCSNDNPYSEARFKTLKYRPEFPDRFGCIEDARLFCRRFFDWYKNTHCRSGIAMLTPSDVHHGRAADVLRARSAVLARAYAEHPERFLRGSRHRERLPAPSGSTDPSKADHGKGGSPNS